MTAIVDGDGPSVVLVHGALGDYRQWAGITEYLRPQYRVVAVSRRHHWPHPPPPGDARYSYETHRDDLLGFLRANGRPVHLVGHSYGAGIVLLAAVHEPKLVKTLILIEPPFGGVLSATAQGIEAELASRNSMLAEVRTLAEAGKNEQASQMLIDWIQGGPGEFARLPRLVQKELLENAKTVGPTFAHVAPDVTCEQLRHVRVPTLVLNGERTRLYYRLVGEAMAACISQAKSAQISNAAHMTIVEKPDDTAALISSFLSVHR